MVAFVMNVHFEVSENRPLKQVSVERGASEKDGAMEEAEASFKKSVWGVRDYRREA